MVRSHTVHLPLGALLSWCTMCGTGGKLKAIEVVPIAETESCPTPNTWTSARRQVFDRAAHGALPHRAPSTRCTADRVHRVWRQVFEGFAAFDVSRAQCFKPEDRSHLLSVIEAGYGTYLPTYVLLTT